MTTLNPICCTPLAGVLIKEDTNGGASFYINEQSFAPGDDIDIDIVTNGTPRAVTFNFTNNTGNSEDPSVVTLGTAGRAAWDTPITIVPSGSWRFAVEGVHFQAQNSPGNPNPIAALSWRNNVLYNGSATVNDGDTIDGAGFTLTSDSAIVVQGSGTVPDTQTLTVTVTPPSTAGLSLYASLHDLLGHLGSQDPTFTIKSVPPNHSPCNCSG